MTLAQWIDWVGPMFFPLALCSIGTLAICLERAWVWGCYIAQSQPGVRPLFSSAFKKKNQELMRQYLAGTQDPVLILFQDARAHVLPFSESSRLLGEELLGRLGAGRTLLNLIVMISPLVGILGTILGIMDAFGHLQIGSSDLSAVTTGISQALVSTAWGLGIAIMALIPYSLIGWGTRKIQQQMEYWVSHWELWL